VENPETRPYIEITIIGILENAIDFDLTAEMISGLYRWTFNKAQELVPVLIWLNQKKPYEHAPVQTILFAVDKVPSLL
jgi:hypothetical protein